MAFIRGYVVLPTNNYLAWKNAVAGNGYNADGYYGCQCWDLCAEFWNNIGFPQGFPQTGPNHYAAECWSVSRTQNAGDKFDLIYNISDVKQGDVIVWNGTSAFPTGHIGFADEDYDGSGEIAVLGQNQGTGGVPIPVIDPEGGTTANVKRLGIANFAGAFRYKEWSDPPIPVKRDKENFKWVLYARKLNQMRNGM